MKILFVSLLFISTHVLAHEHREHGAHVHGGGQLSIAFDSEKGKVEFQGASEGILGFEHEAKSDKDKKILNESIANFESQISKMVQLDASLNCQFTKEKIAVIPDGKHSDFSAKFVVVCAKTPAGTVLSVDFSTFPKIKDLDVVVLVDNIQKSAEAKGKPIKIELK